MYNFYKNRKQYPVHHKESLTLSLISSLHPHRCWWVWGWGTVHPERRVFEHRGFIPVCVFHRLWVHQGSAWLWRYVHTHTRTQTNFLINASCCGLSWFSAVLCWYLSDV